MKFDPKPVDWSALEASIERADVREAIVRYLDVGAPPGGLTTFSANVLLAEIRVLRRTLDDFLTASARVRDPREHAVHDDSVEAIQAYGAALARAREVLR